MFIHIVSSFGVSGSTDPHVSIILPRLPHGGKGAEAIQSLNILPERCALVESEPERTQGLRQMLVDNYSVFYIVGEDTVSVARVLYSASDLVRRLRRMK